MGLFSKKSVVRSNTIDVVSLSPDNQTVILAIAEVEPWTGDNEQLLSLSEKLKNYTAYALDGQLATDYPESQGKKVVVRVDSSRDLPQNVVTLIDKANEHYATDALTFEAHFLN